MAHTPGEWRVESGTFLIWGGCDADLPDHMGVPILEATEDRRWAGNRNPTAEQKSANVRLAAAAPQLLDACHALLGLLQLVAGRDDVNDAVRAALTISHRIDDARAAIAAATGEIPT